IRPADVCAHRAPLAVRIVRIHEVVGRWPIDQLRVMLDWCADERRSALPSSDDERADVVRREAGCGAGRSAGALEYLDMLRELTEAGVRAVVAEIAPAGGVVRGRQHVVLVALARDRRPSGAQTAAVTMAKQDLTVVDLLNRRVLRSAVAAEPRRCALED